MSKPLEWHKTHNMFGYSYSLKIGESQVTVAENLEQDWQAHQKNLRKGFWFRAPHISIANLATTLSFLGDLENNFDLQVTGESADKLSASLRLSDETDAATVAWTLTTIWMKWSKSDEKELKSTKPAKIRVTKSGKIKATVTVTGLDI